MNDARSKSPGIEPREEISSGENSALRNTASDGRSEATVELRLPEVRTFGRYELRQVLGRGGMGSVYLAHDTLLDRAVAIKIPTLDPNKPAQRERLREARAVALLAHPAICQIYDVGEIEGQPYLTMALIEGPSLAQRLLEHGPFDSREAAGFILPVARAMQHAHQAGILHRDLKPSNILFNAKGEPSLVDFGLAFRFDEETSERLTEAGLVVGTPAYMPPEQFSGQNLGPAADVYSLGVVLYETLTGKVPFDAPLGKMLAQIESVPPPPFYRVRPGVDPVLEAICLKALAKKPEERFADMAEFGQALVDFLEGNARLVDFAGRPDRRLSGWWGVFAAAICALAVSLVFTWNSGWSAREAGEVRPPPVAPLAPDDQPPPAAEDEEPPPVDPEREALERLIAHVGKPVLKVEYPLDSENATRVARDTIPAKLLEKHRDPLYFVLSGGGNDHVIDMTDQPGQGGQLYNFQGGEVTVLGPYFFFVGNVGLTTRVFVHGGPGISILAPMGQGSGSKHIEFDGTHLLPARIDPPEIELTDSSDEERAALRNKKLTKKAAVRYPNAGSEYVIFTRPNVQVLPSDPAARGVAFPEIHTLIELDRQRQLTALTIREQDIRAALKAGVPESNMPTAPP